MTLSFVFPGQGSQYLGMLSEYDKQYVVIKDTFSQVSDALGYDVWQLVQEGPLEKLNQTEFTQVAMLTADVAVARVLSALNIEAPISAGHSLGEYAALVDADAIQLEDAAQLVQSRGQIMQKHVPLGEGSMAAIVGLSDEEVETLCHQASDDTHLVSPANYNAIGQVVIAGHKKSVLNAIQLAEQLEARLAKEIEVSVPCHCKLLREASHIFSEKLHATPFKTPSKRVLSNVDVSVYDAPDRIRTLLTKQLYLPVQWVKTIQCMKSLGVESIVESGPGKVLTGLTKRIDRSLSAKHFGQIVM